MPQDFSRQNLRGRSFKGQDLTGANFSHADIRGTDFSGANLRGANFSHAKAGLQKRWTIGLVIISWLLAGISGFFSWFAFYFVVFVFVSNKLENITVGIASLFVLAVFFIVVIHKGFGAGLGVVAFIVAITGSIAVAMFGQEAAIVGAVAVAGAVVGAVAVAVAIVIAIASVVAEGVAVAGAIVAVVVVAGYQHGSIIVTETVILLSAYTGWRAVAGDEKNTWIREISIAFAAIGGTSFRGCDLTNSIFTQSTLRNTDFRKAILTRTCWHQVEMLDFIRSSKTYLQNPQVRQLLITGQGQEKNFDRQILRGVNLQQANLADASFIGTDLSEATFKDADLSRAKLVQTQLDGTDFTGATLTGAFIEDWNITTDTKFDGVRCEYVYMRLPTPDNPDPHRKPDNRQEVFADGEFGDFIKPIFDTLDLYHSQGVDPRAIAISFKQLAENHPEADLRIVGMEVRGEDKFLLRAKTAIAADKSQLSAEYFATYNQLKALAEQEVKALIAEKDSRIADLQNMVVTALQRPSFYSNVEQVGFMTNNPGGFSVGGSVDGDINNVQGENNQQRVSNKSSSFNLQGAQFAGGLVNADTVNAQQIGGNITNYSTEQKQNLAQAAAEIQQLLNQLSQTNPTTTTSEKMSVVAKAVDEIERNPTLKARVIGALKAGGTEALKELIDNPLINILLASIDGWQDAE
ncbi:MAG: pentapeptide repeat-containing protein [Nostoc sp.]|uniref:pentapeptide repeat-containing protein n=1 Tax=Nostoc sp. TaxID=1180 RepID=UPI002FF5D69D